MRRPIRFDASHIAAIANHPYVEKFAVQPTYDGMEFEFMVKADSPIGVNISSDWRRIFVEFTSSAYCISWVDIKHGTRRKSVEARDLEAEDHVYDVMMNIVDYLAVLTEDERGERYDLTVSEEVEKRFNPFAIRALRFMKQLVRKPRTHPDRWERRQERHWHMVQRERRLPLYPFKGEAGNPG